MSTADRLTTEKNESKILPPKQNLRLYKHVQSKLAMQNRTRESTFTRNTSDHRTSLTNLTKNCPNYYYYYYEGRNGTVWLRGLVVPGQE